MTAITVQNASDAGLNHTMAAAALSMSFPNDGHTFLVIANGDTGTPTCTITVQNPSPPVQGFNPITLSNKVVTLPATGTNGGREIIGPFGQSQYNDSAGLVQIAFSATTSLTVAAVSLPRV
ncbi:hypothetical protein [Zavarzinella formosa]|uniref:hypothetical protein n=1 Tax=Zavarzinella formosa TaxID=360055 RepID=UPI00031FD73E|nr:hypothetical protein [Zavarzinella formosa]